MPLENLISLEIERACISGLLAYPHKIVELPVDISSEDFSFAAHKLIFSVVRSIIQNNEVPDSVLIAERISKIGIALPENIDIFEYIQSLSIIQVNEDAFFAQFAQLKKYSICRNIDKTTKVIQEAIRTNLNLQTSEIIHKVDTIYNNQLDSYNVRTDDLVNIYEVMEQTLMENIENPMKDIGIASPFPIFNRYFGAFRKGDVYTVVSRAGVGKSTWLTYVSNQILLNNPKVKVLYLDTEMYSRDALLRMAASISDVPFYYLDSGQWFHDKEMHSKVMAALKFIKGNNRFFHRYVANVPIDDIVSIIKSWFLIHCERYGSDIEPLVVYDYMKISGEQTSAAQQEHQIVGSKLNKAKEICMRIGAPLLTAVQMNRLGVNSNKRGEEVTDDSSVIALSDRIIQFSSYVGIFRHKTFTEIERDGEKLGTHLLKTLKARFQGKEGFGHSDWVKIDKKDEKPVYMQNYINYNVFNFNIKETVSLKDLVARQKLVMEKVPANDSQIF